MIHRTRGIVLHHLKYGDTSLIVTIYTETHGRRAFLVQGVYGRKGKFHPSFFQPFSLLNLEVYINPKRDLQRIKEISFNTPLQSISFATTKSALALFICEILYKTIKEEEANTPLFAYLYHSIELLDLKESGVANFHLMFLIGLSKHLGFYPMDNFSEIDNLFDPANGRFYASLVSQSGGVDLILSRRVHEFLSSSYQRMDEIPMNHKLRNELLNLLIEFYNLHLGGLSNIKSLSVLQSVFDND